MAIFGETSLGIILVGSLAILFVLFKNLVIEDSLQQPNDEDKKIFFAGLWFVWLILTGVSLLTTLSIPLTLNKYFYWVFSFLFFSFFSSASSKWLRWSLVKSGLLLIGAVLSLLSISATLFPMIKNHLPTMNLLVATYGHNHIAAFILFLLPICWEFWESKKYKLFSSLLLFLLVGVLLISFGRVAIILGLLELLILYWKRGWNLTQKMKLFCYLLFFFFVTTIITLVGFSVLSSVDKDFKCLIPQIEVQLCKPFREEPRAAYWSQALRSFEDKPVTGWGGGTFRIISLKYSDHPFQFTTYTHNQYLQLFSEYGFIAGLFFSSIAICLLISLLKVLLQRNIENSSSFFLAVGLVALMIDNFFDYDWEFNLIWLIFLLGVCYFLFGFTKRIDQKKVSKIAAFFSKGFLFLANICIFLFVGLFLFSQLLWWQGNLDLSFKTFPLIYWKVEDKIGTSQISEKTSNSLQYLYRNHEEQLLQLTARTPNDVNKQPIIEKLIKLNTDKYLFDYLVNLSNQQKWSDFSQEMNKFNQNNINEYVTNGQVQKLASISIVGGNELLLERRYQLATELYKTAYRVGPQEISHTKPTIITHLSDLNFSMDLSFLDQFEIKYLGEYWEPLRNWYWSRMFRSFDTQNSDDFALSLQKLLELNPDHKPTICRDLHQKSHFEAPSKEIERIITNINCQKS